MKALEKLSDEKLVQLGREGNCDAVTVLVQRYRKIAAIKAKKYYMEGGDRDDVVQEALIGIFNGIRDFDFETSTSFATFVNICIERQIQTAIQGASRKKHRILSQSISLDAGTEVDHEYGEYEELSEILESRDPENDPEAMALVSDAVRRLRDDGKCNFSQMESKVWQLMLEGKSPKEISKELDKNYKTVDNAIQRIRNKLKKAFQ